MGVQRDDKVVELFAGPYEVELEGIAAMLRSHGIRVSVEHPSRIGGVTRFDAGSVSVFASDLARAKELVESEWEPFGGAQPPE